MNEDKAFELLGAHTAAPNGTASEELWIELLGTCDDHDDVAMAATLWAEAAHRTLSAAMTGQDDWALSLAVLSPHGVELEPALAAACEAAAGLLHHTGGGDRSAAVRAFTASGDDATVQRAALVVLDLTAEVMRHSEQVAAQAAELGERRKQRQAAPWN